MLACLLLRLGGSDQGAGAGATRAWSVVDLIFEALSIIFLAWRTRGRYWRLAFFRSKGA